MLLNLRKTSGPLYRRIYDGLKSGIRAGRLGPATRLPSSRALALDLGVSRNTVALAYEQLAAEGYIVIRSRSKTLVASGVPVSASHASKSSNTKMQQVASYGLRLKPVQRLLMQGESRSRVPHYDFRYGRPALDEFPREIWRRLLVARARRASWNTLGYSPPAGYGPLRAALADYLKRARGLTCDADQIVMVNGSQQAIDLTARVLLDPTDAVVVEEPHYPGATLAFEAAGARVIPVPVDAEGIDIRRLPKARRRIQLAYVTPCHQFPSGVVMPFERRLALLDWASQSGSWIVEDDYVSEFRYEGRPLEVLQSLDRDGRVIYVGSFSKTLFPALRLAYVVLPRPLLPAFLAAKWLSDRFSPLLPQEALADFITSGQFERYLRRAGGRNAARRRALVSALKEHLGDDVQISSTESTGVHLVAWLSGTPSRDLDALIKRAADLDVGIYSITPYYFRPPREAGLLFGYASLTETDIHVGISRLAQAVRARK